jgi:hypothetical protein
MIPFVPTQPLRSFVGHDKPFGVRQADRDYHSSASLELIG